mmetsp:Transcript_18915/g.31675  ORF Transcript_18915/g.31675 Transcript_18915/m.31675 type:complete len:478 (+) Transcript_18915:32-1465(+)
MRNAVRLPRMQTLPLHTAPPVYDAVRCVYTRICEHDHSRLANSALLTSLLQELGLHTCAPLLATLPRGFVDGASGVESASRDLRRFLVAVGRPVAANPLLVAFIEQHAALLHVSGAEAHRLLHYCLLMHLVTQALAEDPALAAAVFGAQRQARQQPQANTRLNLSLFELAKILTVERSLELFISHRSRGVPLPPNFGETGLPFNILEAVLQDATLLRHTPNACAGIPLMMARPGLMGDASLSPDARKVVRMHVPQPRAWKDLYVSWNLAFTTTYADFPYFAMALLAPCVMGALPEEFIFHRTFALHLHITAWLVARQTSGSSRGFNVMGERDWRMESLTDAWGVYNLRHAWQFHHRLHAPSATTVASRARSGRGLHATQWHDKLARPVIATQVHWLRSRRQKQSIKSVTLAARAHAEAMSVCACAFAIAFVRWGSQLRLLHELREQLHSSRSSSKVSALVAGKSSQLRQKYGSELVR